MATSRLLTFLCFFGLPTILSCPALGQSKAFSGFGAEIDSYIK
ncbi:hypothetical protein [[Haemophilus] ducreyi]|nr:hypothetical protein [[Haemophilus] ducreyi]